jgi:hypothetical protein
MAKRLYIVTFDVDDDSECLEDGDNELEGALTEAVSSMSEDFETVKFKNVALIEPGLSKVITAPAD